MGIRSGWIWACALALSGLEATAGRAAEDRVRGEMVEFPGGSGAIRGYLAWPEGDGPFPALVLVHEWWGLTPWIEQNARRLAGWGFVALAVDLYGGKATDDPDVAHELMRALDDGEALADLNGGIAYLRRQPFVAKDRKLGAIGWCMGGKFSRLIAQESDAIGPTVICYGSVATEDGQVKKLAAHPVLGIFGAQDRGIPAAKAEQFGEALRRHGGQATIRIYPGAGHGFMRPGGMQYRAEAAEDAWVRIQGFFARNLR